MTRVLKTNAVLKEIDISYSGWGMKNSDMDGLGFAKGLADGVSANRALTSLDLSSNIIGSEGIKVVAEAIKMIVRMHGCWLFD